MYEGSDGVKKFLLNLIEKDIIFFEKVDQSNLKDVYEALSVNGNVISYLQNPTERMCELAIEQNGLALEFIKNQTEELCLKAVRQNGLALQFVQQQTDFICLEAVKQNPHAFFYVQEKKEAFAIQAVKGNPFLIKFIEHQTEGICLETVKRNGLLIEFVDSNFLSDRLKLLAVKQNPKAIDKIKHPNSFLIMESIKGGNTEVNQSQLDDRCLLELAKHKIDFIFLSKKRWMELEYLIKGKEIYRFNSSILSFLKQSNILFYQLLLDLTKPNSTSIRFLFEEFEGYIDHQSLKELKEYYLMIQPFVFETYDVGSFKKYYLEFSLLTEDELANILIHDPKKVTVVENERLNESFCSALIVQNVDCFVYLPRECKTYQLCRMAVALEKNLECLSPYVAEQIYFDKIKKPY